MDDYSFNANVGLACPAVNNVTVKGNYNYYHYNCDKFNDAGWGCGYRTTQTICSWIRFQMLEKNKQNNIEIKVADVPSILDIQKILVDCGDKQSQFLGSKQWIGCFESSIVIDTLYDVPCKILHCEAHQINKYFDDIWLHYEKFNSIVMMGGDLDNESKGVLGVAKNDKKYFLIADPHCRSDKPSRENLQRDKWISWENISLFDNGSFYNFCLPQLKTL